MIVLNNHNLLSELVIGFEVSIGNGNEFDAQAIVDAGAPKGETKAIDNIAVNKWHHIQL